MLKRFLMLTTAVVAVVAIAAGFTFALFTSAAEVQTNSIQTGSLTIASDKPVTAMWELENIQPTTGRVNNLIPNRWEVANTGTKDAWFRFVGYSRGDIFFCDGGKFDIYVQYSVVSGGISTADEEVIESGEAIIGPAASEMGILAEPDWFQPNVFTVKVPAGKKLRMNFDTWMKRNAGNACQGPARGSVSMYILASQFDNNTTKVFPNAFTIDQARADRKSVV